MSPNPLEGFADQPEGRPSSQVGPLVRCTNVQMDSLARGISAVTQKSAEQDPQDSDDDIEKGRWKSPCSGQGRKKDAMQESSLSLERCVYGFAKLIDHESPPCDVETGFFQSILSKENFVSSKIPPPVALQGATGEENFIS